MDLFFPTDLCFCTDDTVCEICREKTRRVIIQLAADTQVVLKTLSNDSREPDE